MATTYTPHYDAYTYSHHLTYRPTWAEIQAASILNLRDVSNPPAKNPDADLQTFDANRQIHARWGDPDLASALSRLQETLPQKAKISFQFGGRDVTAATWVLVHQTLPGSIPELKYVLWFHEYDDLDVEVGEFADVKWDMKWDMKKDEEGGDKTRKVKMEGIDMDQ